MPTQINVPRVNFEIVAKPGDIATDEVLSGLVHVLKGTTMFMRALHKHV